MKRDDFFKNLRTNLIGEFIDKEGNTEVIYISFKEESQEIIAGSACNAGIIPIVTLPFDDNFSIYSHLEAINEELYEYGYQHL